MTPSTLLALVAVAISSPVASPSPMVGQSAGGSAETSGSPNDSPAAVPDDARWYRVSAANAFVRSDASATVAYPIGRVPEGTLLPVLEERFGWARIRGSESLGDLHGFLPAETAAVSEDGRFVVVSVRTPLKAANLAARQDPARSWKEIARVAPGDRLRLVETVGSDGEAFHKVVLPPTAAAWINLAFLSPATPEEIRKEIRDARADATEQVGELELIADPVSDPANEMASPAPAIVAATDPTLDPELAAEATTVEMIASDDDSFVDIETLGPESPANRLSEPKLEDLESIWTRISEAPETPAADIEELRGRYVALASSESSTASVRARATLRAEQIVLQQQIQNRLAELRRLQEQNLMNLQAIRDVRAVIESRTDYEAVGRLNTSLVYDGRRLPLLYRLQEAGEGATVAYLVPTSDFRLAEMTGQLVGVDGVVRYDEALRLNIITPDRVEILKESSP